MSHILADVTRQSGMGLPHSKTLSGSRIRHYLRKVVECGSPVPLFSPILLRFSSPFIIVTLATVAFASDSPRERICINDGWRFTKGDPTNNATSQLYDIRRQESIRHLNPAESDGNTAINDPAATSNSTTPSSVIKQWILPTGNPFISDQTTCLLSERVRLARLPKNLCPSSASSPTPV